jgi:membrane-bound lytic murein transglycosylase D
MLQENFDVQLLDLLPELDQEKVQQLFRDLQARFGGAYVVDIAALKSTAQTVLPLLESYEETQPYATWLKTRLDYFEVAEQYRATNAPPKVAPGQPPQPIPNPSPQVERKLWRRQLASRPVPKGAEQLKVIFAEQKAPTALVWLAEVESSFDARARSPAGAAGLYQLMPATAKRLGLSLWLRDERYSAEKSARAASQHLNYLHGRFKDWPLALAAYNAGEGHVQRLLDKYQTRSFDGIATHLPAETQMYVPKVDATLQRREGVSLAQLPPPKA